MTTVLGDSFIQSIHMVADEMGFAIDPGIRVTHEIAVATAPIACPMGVIEPGRVGAQRFSWQATVGGEPVISAIVNWLMGDEHLEPAWTFGPKVSASRSRSSDPQST